MSDSYRDLMMAATITGPPDPVQARALIRLAAVLLFTQPGLPEQPWETRLREAFAVLDDVS